MNRLPLPNWNCPPNMNPNGGFLPLGYGCVPFVHQPHQSYPPPYVNGYQNMFVPRHPVRRDYENLKFQVSFLLWLILHSQLLLHLNKDSFLIITSLIQTYVNLFY